MLVDFEFFDISFTPIQLLTKSSKSILRLSEVNDGKHGLKTLLKKWTWTTEIIRLLKNPKKMCINSANPQTTIEGLGSYKKRFYKCSRGLWVPNFKFSLFLFTCK